MSVEIRKPAVTADDAARLLLGAYGIDGQVEPLAGERDATLAVRGRDGARYVLKIAPAGETDEILALEVAALDHVAQRQPRLGIPRVLPGSAGERIGRWTGPTGQTHGVRLCTWVPGKVWALTNPHTPAMRRSLGAAVARLTAALEGFDHPAAHRAFVWDLTRTDRVLYCTAAIADPGRRKRAESILGALADSGSRLAGLPRGVLYNDANDWNVLVGGAGGEASEVIGFVDFGDLLAGPVVADLAVAVAYGVMGTRDPLAAAADIVSGYHGERALGEAELSVLFPLVLARLALSVAVSAERRSAAPGDEYLSISEARAWAVLDRLDGTTERMAEYTFRAACGLEPCPASLRLRRWLVRSAETARPVLGAGLAAGPVVAIDLAIDSPDFGTLADLDDLERTSHAIERRIADAGARVGIGGWNEVRAIYRAAPFRTEGNERDEYRTVHVGLDLFVAAGTPVCAPFDGIVHSFRDNAGRYDYGPTLILEHRVRDAAGDFAFHTLYGHLGVESLHGLQAGAAVSAGDVIAHVGDSGVNGGWPPHLHFQLICDLLGRRGEFPGVAGIRDRAVWLSLSPDPGPLLGLPALPGTRVSPDAAGIAAAREARLGPNLSLSYRKPLHVVRGFRQFLYDADGQPYLDCVNNVAHVGHCHPRVVAAAHAQKAVLETNTRYLHGAIIRLAERLTATLPPSLEVCFFVNSGSEANELALRLARTYTRRRGLVVLDSGYHGNTTALIDASPWKHDGPGGEGSPPWLRKIPLPDPYRGRYRDDPDAGAKYASHVSLAVTALRESCFEPAALLAEPIVSCGGQVVPPDGFLVAAWERARVAGAVCIADEVQTGLGRVGDAFWAFQLQGGVPDVVTIGKPFGNGHPLAAVVTTRAIADAFANGMEYFNTFGGNPASCAIGLAVLDAIEQEALRENARDVGAALLRDLRALAGRHPLIGDVRGRGLFLGFELVADREARTPASVAATGLVNRAREKGVLLATDGPDHNVIKIKPPLCFTRADAEHLVAVVDEVLAEDAFRL